LSNAQSLGSFFCILCFIVLLGWLSKRMGGNVYPVVIGAFIGMAVSGWIIEAMDFDDASREVAITNAICMQLLPILWDIGLFSEWLPKHRKEKERLRLCKQRIEIKDELRNIEVQVLKEKEALQGKVAHLNLLHLLEVCSTDKVLLSSSPAFTIINAHMELLNQLNDKKSQLENELELLTCEETL